MRLVLDAGALIAVERDDRRTLGLIEAARRTGANLVTSAPAVGQVWRDGARQAHLARFLQGTDIRPVDLQASKDAGLLLATSGGDDVIDALVALLAVPGDQVLTSDDGDLNALLEHRPGPVTVVHV